MSKINSQPLQCNSISQNPRDGDGTQRHPHFPRQGPPSEFILHVTVTLMQMNRACKKVQSFAASRPARNAFFFLASTYTWRANEIHHASKIKCRSSTKDNESTGGEWARDVLGRRHRGKRISSKRLKY